MSQHEAARMGFKQVNISFAGIWERWISAGSSDETKMAQVMWKDIFWTGADRELSIKQLLTILKGNGPMELVAFEKTAAYKGELNVWLDENGARNITIYHLEVFGKKRSGKGRQALKDLRGLFGGEVYIEHPGGPTLTRDNQDTTCASHTERTLPAFWIKMFEENLVQSVEDHDICLCQNTPHEQLEALKREYFRFD
jgi:hypothetical protein